MAAGPPHVSHVQNEHPKSPGNSCNPIYFCFIPVMLSCTIIFSFINTLTVLKRLWCVWIFAVRRGLHRWDSSWLRGVYPGSVHQSYQCCKWNYGQWELSGAGTCWKSSGPTDDASLRRDGSSAGPKPHHCQQYVCTVQSTILLFFKEFLKMPAHKSVRLKLISHCITFSILSFHSWNFKILSHF